MERGISMRYMVEDRKYHFKYAFDTETGAYVRTGMLDEKGKDTGIDPFQSSFPHLIDVGVMGHCIHGKTGLCAKAGIECYQNGMYQEAPNMSVEDFREIVKQCEGKTNQLALGGRGDPDQHEKFAELLEISRAHNLVSNFTTSGYGMTENIAKLCKKYCGAVAVSWYRSRYTLNAIKMLFDAGVKTNIHYVLGKNSIDEAIERLSNDDFPSGINAVIFLLHKPVGQGTVSNMLSPEDPKLSLFFKQVEKRHKFLVGMDSCLVPGAINFCNKINTDSLDTCEGGRFSCYISSDMRMTPCSFDQKMEYAVSLREHTIAEAWESLPFQRFRKHLSNSCPNCSQKALCMGGCPLKPQIVLCSRNEKQNIESEGGVIHEI